MSDQPDPPDPDWVRLALAGFLILWVIVSLLAWAIGDTAVRVGSIIEQKGATSHHPASLPGASASREQQEQP